MKGCVIFILLSSERTQNSNFRAKFIKFTLVIYTFLPVECLENENAQSITLFRMLVFIFKFDEKVCR